jgi:FMN-dependent oxidoreductase (nitrilotriacetate monooxygenase family)
MKLAVFLNNAGGHPAGWRAPRGGPVDLCDISTYAEMAQIAEKAKFHLLFAGDSQGFQHIEGKDAFSRSDFTGKLEPTTTLAALAMVTRHIGLAATASTSYNEPYALARRFASIDHISHGRAGWNVVTSANENEAHNFGLEAHLDHAFRYERAEEFIDVVKGLWDCWEDDAVERNAETGRYFDPAKLHGLGHEGRFFKVAGPLNICRPPQGHPVIIQAGASEAGRRMAARTADLVFAGRNSLQRAREYSLDLKQRAAAFGRDPDSLSVMTSMQFLVRSTEAEAKAAEKDLLELVPPQLALSRLQTLLGGMDLSAVPLDGPLPDFPVTNHSQSVQQQVIDTAREEGLTVRELANRVSVGRSSFTFAGTPEQVADICQSWFECGAADGFSIAMNTMPDSAREFAEQVVPILQARGLFRMDYEEGTLRDNLGLPRPINRFAADPSLGVEPEIWAKVSDNG